MNIDQFMITYLLPIVKVDVCLLFALINIGIWSIVVRFIYVAIRRLFNANS